MTVTLGTLPNFSGPQFPHLLNNCVDKMATYVPFVPPSFDLTAEFCLERPCTTILMPFKILASSWLPRPGGSLSEHGAWAPLLALN